jgi:hypothetical protein
MTSIENGDIVEVKGSALLPGGALVAASVRPTRPVSGTGGDRVEIDGFVTSFDAASPQTFEVAGVPAQVTSTTIVSEVRLGLDARVGVAGSLAADGTVLATRVQQGFDLGPPRYTVVGQLFSGSGAVGSVPINLWVQRPNFGYSYWWANGALYSNSRGEFNAPFLPESEIFIHAGHGPWVQPCGVSTLVPGTSYLQVELIAADAFESASTPLQPQVVTGTSMTGTVFETVDGVKQPVAGALVWAYVYWELDVASTRTDLAGRFFLCNLPPNPYLSVSKSGYMFKETDRINPPTPIEIELQRN